jgi:hypothetical protein
MKPATTIGGPMPRLNPVKVSAEIATGLLTIHGETGATAAAVHRIVLADALGAPQADPPALVRAVLEERDTVRGHLTCAATEVTP